MAEAVVEGVVVVEVNMNKYLIITIIIPALIIGGFFLKASLTGSAIGSENLQKVTLKVSIPCPGHAFLIKQGFGKLDGVGSIEYFPITTFVVYYDSTKVSKQDILNLDIFKDYPAKEI